jgi:hypothetical protein
MPTIQIARVRRLGLAIAITALCSPLAHAQLAGVIPSRSAEDRAAESGNRAGGPLTNAGITPTLVTDILLRFQSDPAKIGAHINTLVGFLTSPPIDGKEIAPVLRLMGIRDDLQSVVTTILTTMSSSATSIPLKQAVSSFFTSAATSVTHDRALATSTVAELVFSRATARFVTATAISSAKDGDEGNSVTEGQAEEFRTRTADLLTMMQTGGNGVARLYMPLIKPGDTKAKVNASMVVDAGVMGDWLNANTRSRFTGGGVLEVTGLILESSSSNDPGALFLSARIGARWSNKGVVTGLLDDRLFFGQFLVELRIPGGKIPIGISANLVEKQFRKYTLPIHIYTNIGR